MSCVWPSNKLFNSSRSSSRRSPSASNSLSMCSRKPSSVADVSSCKVPSLCVRSSTTVPRSSPICSVNSASKRSTEPALSSVTSRSFSWNADLSSCISFCNAPFASDRFDSQRCSASTNAAASSIVLLKSACSASLETEEMSSRNATANALRSPPSLATFISVFAMAARISVCKVRKASSTPAVTCNELATAWLRSFASCCRRSASSFKPRSRLSETSAACRACAATVSACCPISTRRPAAASSV